MTRIERATSLPLLTRLRLTVHDIAASAAGLLNIAAGRDRGPRVALLRGDLAPDFSLRGSDGATYRLSDFRGRQAVVLAWFPKAFTGGCTAECASLGAARDALRRFNVRYFGASVDPEEANERFARSLGIDYPILSDPAKEVARAYGVVSPSGYASRWTFYIGAAGRILDIDRRVAAASHGRDVVAKLTELGISPV